MSKDKSVIWHVFVLNLHVKYLANHFNQLAMLISSTLCMNTGQDQHAIMRVF